MPLSMDPATRQVQLQALKQDITVTQADEVYQGQPLVAWWDAGDDTTLANFYNTPAEPDFWVWKTAVTEAELTTLPSPDGTTFNWTGNGFITRTVQELMCWERLFATGGTVDVSQPNVRQAFQDIFSGTQNAAANRTHLAAMARRLATEGEVLYATGAGTTSAPGTMTMEGSVSPTDVGNCRSA